MSTDLHHIRNIGVIAHIDAGKTTTTERILFCTRRITKMGDVDEGTAVMDWMAQERERGITITAAATMTEWRDCTINIIDTPGHVDFTVEVERSLRVLDGGVVVFDGVAGVEPQSETVWRQADKYGVPRICFVNKMDRLGANFDATVAMITERLGAHPIPLQLPIGSEAAFEGVIDLLERRALRWSGDVGNAPTEGEVPAALTDRVEEARAALIEAIVEQDDALVHQYLEEHEIGLEALRQGLRQATIDGKLVPVLCGASLRNKGIQPLLDAIIDYLPSPLDVPPVAGVHPDTGEVEARRALPEEPLAALAFKIVSDPYVGKLSYLRVYSGVIKSGSYVYNPNKDERERISRLLRMHANHREEVEQVSAGNIAAAVGLKSTVTGDTLCDPTKPIVLERMRFPEPVISMSIEPRTKADQDKMAAALARLGEEDPTFRIRTDPETGQTVISGMGELHLDVIADRLVREFKVGARVGRPQVAYRETISQRAREEGRYVHQTGGHGQYGDVWIEVEPLEPGGGYEFVDKTVGGVIPREFIPAIKAGIVEAMEGGVVSGYPLVDIKVTLVDGSYHEVDSSEIAFKRAGSMALKRAVERAKPQLLEPIMGVEVVVSEPFLGDVVGDLNSRRGRIEGMDVRSGSHTIKARVPLAEMFGYATRLRSLSQGRGNFSMEFSHYEPVSKEVLTH